MSINLDPIDIVIIETSWSPGSYRQGQSRLGRCCPPQTHDPHASRNKREGYYAFRTDGRHTRRHRPAIVHFDSATHQRKKA